MSFGWADILDILMVALIIFFLIRSIRKDSGILNIVLILAVLLMPSSYCSSRKSVTSSTAWPFSPACPEGAVKSLTN